MCGYYIIVSLQWSAKSSFENLVQREENKGEKRGREEGKGKREEKGQGKNCLAG